MQNIIYSTSMTGHVAENTGFSTKSLLAVLDLLHRADLKDRGSGIDVA